MNLPPRRGLALTIVGPLMMLLLAPIVLGLSVWGGIAETNRRLGAHPWVQSGQVHITDTRTQSIMVKSGYADCTVTGPHGRPVALETTNIISLSAYEQHATFEPSVPGDYQVDCEPRAKVMSLAARHHAEDAIGLGIVIGIAAATVVFLLGGILLIVGIVKLVNSGRERRSARSAPASPYQHPGGPDARS